MSSVRASGDQEVRREISKIRVCTENTYKSMATVCRITIFEPTDSPGKGIEIAEVLSHGS